MTLYEITGEIADLQAALSDPDADAETVEQALNAALDNFDDKAESYAKVYRNFLAEAEAIKAEADRLQKRAKTAESAAARMKSAMYDAMILTGQNRLRTNVGTWSISKNPPAVEIINEAVIPEEFMKPQPATVNKNDILVYWKTTGNTPEGVNIVRRDKVTFR